MNETDTAATDGMTSEQGEKPETRDSKPWLEAIKHAETYFSDWQECCDKIDRHYASLAQMRNDTSEREMRLFWANMEVIKPSIYARAPVPVVGARFRDRKPLVRHASEILERSLVTMGDVDSLHQTMEALRDDLSLYGRAVPWVRYNNDDGETAPADHLDRRDFLCEPVRKWRECGWVARRSYQTRKAMIERFESFSGDACLQANFKETKTEEDRDN